MELNAYQFEEMLINQMSGGRGYASLTSDQKQALRDEVAKYMGVKTQQPTPQNQQQPIPESQQPTPEKPTPETSKTGNEMLDETLKAMNSYLETLKSQGMKLNPAIEITPEITQRFVSQAETELEPYYSSQIKAIKGDLAKNFESLQKTYLSQKSKAESEFRSSLASTQEDLAGRGLAFSGQRQKTEQQFGESTGRYFEDLATTTQESGRKLGTATEREIGSGKLDLSYPSIQSYKPQIGTDFSLSETGSRSLFTPETGVVGSLERERLAAREANIARQERKYREDRALTYY